LTVIQTFHDHIFFSKLCSNSSVIYCRITFHTCCKNLENDGSGEKLLS